MTDRQDSMLPSPGRWLRWQIGGSTGGGNQRRGVETGRFQCDDGRGENRMQRSRKGQRMRGFPPPALAFPVPCSRKRQEDDASIFAQRLKAVPTTKWYTDLVTIHAWLFGQLMRRD